MHRADIASAAAGLNERFRFIAVIAYPAVLFAQERLPLFGRQFIAVGIERGYRWIDLTGQQLAWIQYPELFGCHRVPQAAGKPQSDAYFGNTKDDIIPVSRIHGHSIHQRTNRSLEL